MKRSLLITLVIIIILISLIPMKSLAAVPIDSAYIYANNKTDYLLIWDGIRICAHMAVYKKDGQEYPAYCMDRELPGVELGFSQTVDVNQLISNVMVWRAIINGYPYKTIAELGCKTEGEAYLATKQAVYCMIKNRDVNEYSAIGESGERILNALRQIVTNARNSNISKVSSELRIKSENSIWKVDDLDKKYVSQIFTVSANAPFNNYVVNIDNLDIEGFRITDVNNEEKTNFTSNEKFKILIPIVNLNNDGDFTINISGEVATKPIFYGKSRDSGLQNYALTGCTYEDGTGAKKIYFTKNETGIKIVKKDDTGLKNLEGVEFALLDNEKNVLYTDLRTNEDGEVEINNLLPGTYYIKETRTLEDYQLYDKLIKVELELNEKVTVNVINSENQPDINITNITTEIGVQKSESNINIQSIKNKTEIEEIENKVNIKLPKTGM